MTVGYIFGILLNKLEEVNFRVDGKSNGEAVCPENIGEQSICINGDIGQVIAEVSLLVKNFDK